MREELFRWPSDCKDIIALILASLGEQNSERQQLYVKSNTKSDSSYEITNTLYDVNKNSSNKNCNQILIPAANNLFMCTYAAYVSE